MGVRPWRAFRFHDVRHGAVDLQRLVWAGGGLFLPHCPGPADRAGDYGPLPAHYAGLLGDLFHYHRGADGGGLHPLRQIPGQRRPLGDLPGAAELPDMSGGPFATGSGGDGGLFRPYLGLYPGGRPDQDGAYSSAALHFAHRHRKRTKALLLRDGAGASSRLFRDGGADHPRGGGSGAAGPLSSAGRRGGRWGSSWWGWWCARCFPPPP